MNIGSTFFLKENGSRPHPSSVRIHGKGYHFCPASLHFPPQFTTYAIIIAYFQRKSNGKIHISSKKITPHLRATLFFFVILSKS